MEGNSHGVLFFLQTFPGRNRTGCIELGVTGVIYHFQMSAVAVINGDYIEGSLSPFSETTTIFVPLPGGGLLLTICSVRVESSKNAT